MSDIPKNQQSSGIELYKNFNAEEMQRERELLKKLYESQKVLGDAKKEYDFLLRDNPDIAKDIEKYFQEIQLLKNKTTELEENLEKEQNADIANSY